MIINKDKNSYEVNHKMCFKLQSHFEHLRGVTVHLHHSTQTVQIQGSALMPDSRKAAERFSNVTLKRFHEQA